MIIILALRADIWRRLKFVFSNRLYCPLWVPTDGGKPTLMSWDGVKTESLN